jgi:uncharacterized protein DUF6206
LNSGELSLGPIDSDLLNRFETGLDPVNPTRSEIDFTIIGYGEISTVFTIDAGGPVAYKRMPLFATVDDAKRYVISFVDYSTRLLDAGILVPPQQTAIVALPGRPVVLYIAQPLLPPAQFGHTRVQGATSAQARTIVEAVAREVGLVWAWNRRHAPEFELSLDGQLSNWVWSDQARPYYIDTSTPLYRIDGVEQLDSELFLKSAPAMLRWVLRLFFVQDVLTRYYDLRQVFRDLAANLYKEGRDDLVPVAVETLNTLLDGAPLSVRDVDKYYSGDKTIWRVYLGFRRTDRFVSSRILNQRYEFLLPGRIRR